MAQKQMYTGNQAWGWLGAIALGLCASGCLSPTCHRNDDVVPQAFHAGITDYTAHHYETSAVNASYLDFPSGKRYRLFHGLSDIPSEVVPYVSFSPNPLSDRSGFTVSPGNQTVIVAVTPTYIEVKNDTCTDFFLRVVASVGDAAPVTPTPVPTTTDAAADAG
jgi:hypothetical protein